MLILVRLPEKNKLVILRLYSFEKIGAIKQKIEEMERIPHAEQNLYFSFKRLDDHETLAACNIRDDSTLILRLRDETPCDLMGSWDRLIFVISPSNKSIPLVLKSCFTVATVKEAIEKKEGLPFARQCLYFSGRRLENAETLADHDIPTFSTLHLKLLADRLAPWVNLTPYDVTVQVLPVSRFITVRVPQGLKATIGELKDFVHEQEDGKCEDLYLDDDVTGERLGDTVTLQACCLPEKTLVWVQSGRMSIGGCSPCSSSFAGGRNKALLEAGFEEAFRRRRTVPGIEDMESLDVREVPEQQRAGEGQVSDIGRAIATLLQTHKDCDRKLSLMLDEKNKLKMDLLELQNKYPKLLSEVLEEKNKLHRDLKELQNDFPRQLSLVVDEKQKLQQHLNELQNEFLQMSLVLDENAKLQRDSISLQNQLKSLKSKLGQERERSLCNICFDKPRDTLVFSCLHLHFCSSCLQKHQERTNTCPTCRGFISGILVCNVSIS